MAVRSSTSSGEDKPSMFRALRVRNFRIWIIGMLLANIGGWAQRTAQDWFVLTELTNNDAVALGISLSLQFGPILVLGPFVGPLVDRLPGRTIILWAAIAETTAGIVLGVSVLMGVANLALVYSLALALGVVQAVETPARHVFVGELVGKDTIPNAIGMNSTMFNSSRLIGPAFAGIAIATAGSGWTLTGAAVLIGAAVVAVALLRRREFHHVAKVPKEKGQLRQGLRYIRARRDVLVLFTMLFIVGALVFNFGIFSSTMAVMEFGLGAHDYGFITSALALGSLMGALLVARSLRPRISVITVAAGLIAVGGTAAALAPTVTIFMVVYPALGLGGVLMVATINSYLQTTIDDEYRGRVMAIFSTLMIGATPFGSPLVGWVADTFGPRWSIGVAAFGGLLAVLIALIWMRSQHNIGALDTFRSAFTPTPIAGNETATQLITITERGP